MWWPPPYRRPPDRAAGRGLADVAPATGCSRERAHGYDPLVDDPASVSFWLETAGDDLTPRPPLDGSTDADVAILGAGLTGLWTAYYLARRDPSLRIVIVEREIAGFGASGRNGAWCAPDLNISMSRLARLHGEDAARRMQQATYDAVDEVGRACAEAGIDAGFHKGGEIIVARGPQGVPSLEASLREYERFGFGDRYRLVDAAARGPDPDRGGRARPRLGRRGRRPPGPPRRAASRARVEGMGVPDRRGDDRHRRSGRGTRPAGRRSSRRGRGPRPGRRPRRRGVPQPSCRACTASWSRCGR